MSGSILRSVLLVALGLASAGQALAVQRGYGSRVQPRQSAGVSVSFPEFGPDGEPCAVETEQGECEESGDFDFDRPILGLFYSRPGVQLFIGRGAKGAAGGVGDMELVETSINVFGMVSPFSGERDPGLEVFFPYGLHSGFRRLTIRDGSTSSDTFEATVIAVGAGAGLQRGIGATRFLVRAMPAFGLASRSFGFGNGTSTLVDVDAEFTFGPIAGRIGLALGYQYRWQKWRMEEDFVDDRDYSGTQHGFRIGVFW